MDSNQIIYYNYNIKKFIDINYFKKNKKIFQKINNNFSNFYINN